jgi:hypothetical protein
MTTPTALEVALIPGVAHHVAGRRSDGSADSCAFKSAARLVSDDTAGSGSTEATEDGACLSARPTGAGSHECGANDSKDCFFHSG